MYKDKFLKKMSVNSSHGIKNKILSAYRREEGTYGHKVEDRDRNKKGSDFEISRTLGRKKNNEMNQVRLNLLITAPSCLNVQMCL